MLLSIYLIFFFSSKNSTKYVSLTMTTLARNSPLALTIAIISFQNHELISIALVIGPLIELPIIISKFCLWIKNTKLLSFYEYNI